MTDENSTIYKDFVKNTAPFTLNLVVTFGLFYCIYRLSTPPAIPSENRDLLNMLLGVLSTVWVKSMSYWYDSSASSKVKDETISEIAKTVSTSNNQQAVIGPNSENSSINTENKDTDKPESTLSS